jgi:hypothetical protein
MLFSKGGSSKTINLLIHYLKVKEPSIEINQGLQTVEPNIGKN